MTAQQMIDEVGLRLQKVATFAVDNFLDDEILLFLNDAQHRFIKSRFSVASDQKALGFEETVKRLSDLQTLVVAEDVENPSTSGTEYSFTIPAAMMFYGAGRLKSHFRYCGTATVNDDFRYGALRLVNQHSYETMRLNPFAWSSGESPLARMNDGSIIVDARSNFIPKVLTLRYIKYPATIAIGGSPVNSDLPEHTHSEIVDLAVQKILESIESPRFETHTILSSTND